MRLAGRVAIAAGAIALTLGFAATQFPWPQLVPAAERFATDVAGVPVRFGSLGVGIGRLGVAVVADQVRIEWPPDDPTHFATIAARPALSLDWLTGTPRLRIATGGGPADFDGSAGPQAVTGTFAVQDAGSLPWPEEPLLTGTITGDLDLTLQAGNVAGNVAFVAREGSVLPPGLPIGIPFGRLTVKLRFGADRLSVEPAVLEGPLAGGRVTGTISPPAGATAAAGTRWQRARLDLAVDVDHFDRGLQAMLQQYGFDLSPGSRLTIQGTAANPRVR